MSTDPDTWGPLFTALIIAFGSLGIGFTVGLIIGFYLG